MICWMVAQMMNQLHLFLLLLFTLSFVGSIDYHGNQRFWTSVNNGKTNIGLHVLTEPIELFFPKNKTFAQLASDIKLYSSAGNGQCKDTTHSLNFTLTVTEQSYNIGQIKFDFGDLMAFLYETCVLNGNEYKGRKYISLQMGDNPVNLENPGRRCFKNVAASFQVYDKDTSKHVMKLEASGSIECQIFMELVFYFSIYSFLPVYF
uniref:Uncharacterized protein n=1 Tax=Panagrolaimus superbus TaxID=310955 RepID=A0A914Y1B4_9BILA